MFILKYNKQKATEILWQPVPQWQCPIWTDTVKERKIILFFNFAHLMFKLKCEADSNVYKTMAKLLF